MTVHRTTTRCLLIGLIAGTVTWLAFPLECEIGFQRAEHWPRLHVAFPVITALLVSATALGASSPNWRPPKTSRRRMRESTLWLIGGVLIAIEMIVYLTKAGGPRAVPDGGRLGHFSLAAGAATGRVAWWITFRRSLDQPAPRGDQTN